MNNLNELEEQKKEIESKIRNIKKAEKEEMEKKHEQLKKKVYNIYDELLSEFDIDCQIQYEYWDDSEDSDMEMVNRLILCNDYKPYAEIDSCAEIIINEEIEKSKSFAKAMNNHTNMLEKFKEEILKLK